LQSKFEKCKQLVNDANKANLDLQGYQSAVKAAAEAGVSTSDVLAIWSNENSLKSSWQRGSQGEVGPMQIKPIVKDTLANWGILPANWNTDISANLEAGALYYHGITTRFNPSIPQSEAAAAYNGGTAFGNKKNRGPRDKRRYDWPTVAPDAYGYQEAFDDRKRDWQDFVDCMNKKN
jgi:soluble lytic murein transglycosylase-like protein